MQVLQVILNIIIFLVCLSLVVCIHEAGHLSMAKLFHVYCFEYSIGFGPKLFSKKFIHRKLKGQPFDGTPVFDAKEEEKRKADESASIEQKEVVSNDNLLVALDDSVKEEKPKKKKEYHFKDTDKYNYYEGETAFSIRALPLGGYVAMAGEEGEENEAGIDVPKERTLLGVNHLKQIIIMLAGIFMNFVLAILLLIVDFGLCPQTSYDYNTNEVSVSEKLNNETSPAYNAGLRSGDKILTLYQVYHNLKDSTTGEVVADKTFPEGWDSNPVTLTMYVNSDYNTPDDYSKTSIAYAIQDVVARNMSAHDNEGTANAFSVIEAFEGVYADSSSTRDIHLTYLSGNETKEAIVTLGTSKNEDKNNNTSYYTFNKLGISVKTSTFYYNFGQAVSLSFRSFGNLFVSIFQALGSLFTPSGWSNMGGIISVYRVSASGVESGSISFFIYLWAYISINLGCFNLLPFPGLDGWQTLIALFETITRKKASTKFKGIANAVGMIILFALAALLLVKDIIHPAI